METGTYEDLIVRLHGKLGSRRFPLKGTVEVTHRCNLSCGHCYINRPAGDREALSSELTLDEHRRILDEISRAGCLSVLFTGGEPFLRPDFLDIYDHAKRRGLLITIFTNGTLISPEAADRLAMSRPYSIEISLYGSTRQTYEAVTGVPGSFERCLKGIELLSNRGLPLDLKTMAMRTNRHELQAMKRFADELGVKFRFDALLTPRLDSSQGPLAERLLPEEVVALDLQDAERCEEMKGFAERYMPVDLSVSRSPYLYNCGAGFRSFSVDAFGRMTICSLATREAFDLRAGSFREGWDGFLAGQREKKSTRRSLCSGCGIRSLCGACAANAEIECGEPESEVAFLCQVAHLRAKALAVAIPPHGDCSCCDSGPRPGVDHPAPSGARRSENDDLESPIGSVR